MILRANNFFFPIRSSCSSDCRRNVLEIPSSTQCRSLSPSRRMKFPTAGQKNKVWNKMAIRLKIVQQMCHLTHTVSFTDLFLSSPTYSVWTFKLFFKRKNWESKTGPYCVNWDFKKSFLTGPGRTFWNSDILSEQNKRVKYWNRQKTKELLRGPFYCVFFFSERGGTLIFIACSTRMFPSRKLSHISTFSTLGRWREKTTNHRRKRTYFLSFSV